jgi:glycosyltransferase involved in cell wall biosynthesis
MERQVLGGVDYALMGNRASVRVWREKGYKGRLRVIPQFGVDVDLYHPAEKGGNGRVLTIGSANRRLVPEKGVDILLHAAAKLTEPYQLFIAGEGPAKPQLIQLAKQLKISERVHFVGSISSEKMTSFLQKLDILVLSSRTRPNWKEQFGRILIEAMATEVVVVGSHSGEIPNVIGHAGFIFQEDNAHALWVHLDRLAKAEPLRKKFGILGRQRVIENYTQQAIANRTVNVYREMMGE